MGKVAKDAKDSILKEVVRVEEDESSGRLKVLSLVDMNSHTDPQEPVLEYEEQCTKGAS